MFYYATTLWVFSQVACHGWPVPQVSVEFSCFHHSNNFWNLISSIKLLTNWEKVAISPCRAVRITLSLCLTLCQGLWSLWALAHCSEYFCFIWSLLSEKISSDKIENFKQYLEFFSGQTGKNELQKLFLLKIYFLAQVHLELVVQ